MTNLWADKTIEIENETIKKVDRCKYLGQTVMLDEHTKEEVMIIIKAGWSCFGRYKAIFCDQKLPKCLRKRVYDQQ